MCGLVAVINKYRNGFSNDQLDVFEQLLFIDTLRGEDSTGVFGVSSDGNVNITKGAVDGPKFVNTSEWKAHRSKAFANGWALIGHNRKATRGSINDENAHPFWVDDKLVLVHNGTLHGDHKKIADTEVDSHAIAHALSENTDVEKVLQGINAAYALIWYDIQNKALKVIRNSQRPLHWVETTGAVYIASEAEMLHMILSRNKIHGASEIHMFPEYNLNVWELQSDRSVKESAKTIDASYRYVKKEEPKGENTFPGPQRNYYGDGYETIFGDDYTPANTRSVVPILPPVTPPVKVEKEEPKLLITANSDVILENLKQTQEAAKKQPVYPWQKKLTMAEWRRVKEKYPSRTKVRVLVDDFVEDKEISKEQSFLSGKILDAESTRCVFPVFNGVLDSLTSPSGNLDAPVFEVEVNVVGWLKTDNKKEKDVDNMEGVMIVHGQDARLVLNGNTMVQ